MIYVFHLTDRATRDQRCDAMLGYNVAEHAQHCAELLHASLYGLVAAVDVSHVELVPGEEANPYINQLERAYMLTNSIDENASRSIQVQPSAAKGCRSSSVGDVFRVGEAGPDERLFVVASMGFEEITTQVRALRQAAEETA